MFLKLWRKWTRVNQIKADMWVAKQLGDPIFYMPDGPCKGTYLGEVPLQELKLALLRLDPREDEALYANIKSWVTVRVYFEHGVTVCLRKDISD